MKLLYTLAVAAALPFALARLWWRGRAEPLYREEIGERFGFYGVDRSSRLVWIHAVSVGEARAAEPLVRALGRDFADHRILITCTTAGGRATLKQVYGESVLIAWLPYDLPGAVRRFLETIHASACKRFGTVLSPAYNAAHHNHLHLEDDRANFCR